MLRISAISTLLFYVLVTVGIHIDVDTCCKTIADISFTPCEEIESEILVQEDQCCKAQVSNCCEEQSGNCELNSIYFQLLAEEQVVSPRADLDIHVLHILDLGMDVTSETQEDAGSLLLYADSDPPDLGATEELYLQHQAIITYG